MKKAMFAGAAALVVTGAAPTVLAGGNGYFSNYSYNTSLGGGNTFFYPGLGNTNQNFAINSISSDFADGTIELAIKAKKRQGADSATPSYADGSYSVQPGSQVGNSDRWWWNFDYSLDFRGMPDGVDLSDARVDFVIGFVSANGIGNVAPSVVRSVEGENDITGLDYGPTGDLPQGVDAWSGTDGLIQNSSNLAFSDVNDGRFDMNAVGTYTITINVYDDDEDPDVPIGGVTMQVDVNTVLVPLPGAAGMALAGMGLIGLRRRR